MPDWDLVCGFADDGGDPDHDIHDPAGHCGSAQWDPGRVFGGPAASVRCNRCGSTDVRWRQQGGKWVLFGNNGSKHVCPIDDSSFKAIEP